MDVTIKITENEHRVEVQIAGEIDVYTAPKVKDALQAVANKAGMSIVIDLSGVEYMDSTGLGLIVGIYKTLKERNGVLTLQGMNDRILRLFRITGLSEVIHINTEVEGGV